MSKEVYRRLSKAERKLENTNRLRTNNTTLRIKYEGIKKLLEKKDKEIERLNNIINGLEKWLKGEIDYDNNWYNPENKEYIGQKHFPDDTLDGFKYALDKLQELKGGDKE